ncbi:MAG: IS66 family insertion sequence element accessory protein TnpB [Pseudomonadota bacterium]
MEPTTSKAQHWHAHITAWQASGLSQTAYCAQHGLKPATFAYWRSKQSKAADQPLTLIPLHLGTRGAGPILTSPNGWRLDLPAWVEPAWVGELLARLP